MPLTIAARLWPTPHGMCVPNARRAGPSGTTLTDHVTLYPTPAAADGMRGSETYVRGNPTLLGAARESERMWPTPRNRDGQHGHYQDYKENYAKRGRKNGPPLPDAVHLAEGQPKGSLNPDWVEGLMGFPKGWTDLASPESPLGSTVAGSTESLA